MLSVGHAPLVLVTSEGVPEATRAALTRLAPERIVVLGGEAAVGVGVVDELRRLTR